MLKKDPRRALQFGDGKISGYGSLTLGVLSLLAVLAYLYPSNLTTTELRQIYDAQMLQVVLKWGMYTAITLGLLSLVLNNARYGKYGAAGIVLTFIAFALGGYNLPVSAVEPADISLGVDWLILAFLGSIAIFVTLEKIFPKHSEQVILRPEWSTDLFYFVFNHLAISAVILFANYHASHFNRAINSDLQAAIRALPAWLQFAIILVCADFVLYWEHRIFHEVRTLWPIHAVHHSIEHIDWLAGSRGHFIQVFSERAMVMIPLYLLGVEQSILNAYVTFAALQAVVIHCNMNFPFGPFKYIFVTPQFHHWHHSSEKPAIDTNYSAHTLLFDKLFGTYHFPENHWPAHYGTTEKLPKSIVGQVLYPLTKFLNDTKIP